MLTSRDRLLAGLFALQLVAAAAFGLVLVNGLGTGARQQVVTTVAAGPDGAVPVAPSPSPGASAAAVAAFHRAFQWVMLACAVCAGLAGVIGLLTAPARTQKDGVQKAV